MHYFSRPQRVIRWSGKIVKHVCRNERLHLLKLLNECHKCEQGCHPRVFDCGNWCLITYDLSVLVALDEVDWFMGHDHVGDVGTRRVHQCVW